MKPWREKVQVLHLADRIASTLFSLFGSVRVEFPDYC